MRVQLGIVPIWIVRRVAPLPAFVRVRLLELSVARNSAVGPGPVDALQGQLHSLHERLPEESIRWVSRDVICNLIRVVVEIRRVMDEQERFRALF